jgi:hypothetical protein
MRASSGSVISAPQYVYVAVGRRFDTPALLVAQGVASATIAANRGKDVMC